MEVKGRTPTSDLFKSAIELYPSGGLGATGIRISVEAHATMRVWNDNSPEPDWMQRADVETGMFFRLPIGAVQWRSGTPKILLTRQAFEDGLKRFRFRDGTQTTHCLILGLPQDKWMEAGLDLETSSSPTDYRYSDLDESKRAEIWQDACDQAIKDALAIANKQQRN
jgi:hypothetical protein